MDTSTTSLPLGSWLRAAERMLAQRVADALADAGVTRREWRALSAIAGRMPRPELAARPGPHPKHGRRRETVDSLVARGWVTRGADGPTLTPEGTAALDRLTGVVDGVRTDVADLIDAPQLQASLEALVRGLGWEDGQPLPGRSGRRGPGHRHGRGHGGGQHGHDARHGRCRGGGDAGGGREHGRRHAAVEAAFERGYARGFEAGRIA